MKIPASILTGLILGLSAFAPAFAQSRVPFDDFETYALGALGGQGGWTTTNVAGTSQAVVAIDHAFYGAKSLYLFDGDATNNPKAWREPTGADITNGRFAFAVWEDQATAGRDYWTVVFSGVGSSAAKFRLELTSATLLTLYGGASGTTVLATASTTSAGGTYDPTQWNTFAVVFDNTAHTAAVYLNGGATPIMSASDAATSWTAGRYQFSPGTSTFTDMGAYFDVAEPEWETTAKLRYAPQNLVAPTVWVPSNGFATRTFAGDEDVIVRLSSTTTRTGNLGVVGGRNVRVIGGDLGTTYIAPTGQTDSIFLEGLKVDQAKTLTSVNGYPVEMFATKATGCLEKDAMDVCGTTSGLGADVYVQNCSIKGVHGTLSAHAAAVPLSSITCTSISGLGYGVTITTSTAMTLPAGTNWVIVGATDNSKLQDSYKVVLVSPTTSTTFNATRWDSWNPLPPGLTVGDTGTGGYAWPNNPTGSALHADGYESMAEGMHNIAHFYRVTFASNASCILSRNLLDSQGGRGLVMTRVNMSVNTVWPQEYDSQSLHIGVTDQSGGTWGASGFPVFLDRVYLKPRANRDLVAAVYPGANTTRNGVDVSATSTDGGASVHWPAALDVTGSITKSTDANGYPLESGYTTKDYADLTGANAPGLGYVSPGYSAEAFLPLKLAAVVGIPAITSPVTVPQASAVGTLVTRIDVTASGDGHVVDLALTDASGQFGFDAANPRNVVVKSALAVGTYSVTVTASEDGNPSNLKAQVFSIQVQ